MKKDLRYLGTLGVAAGAAVFAFAAGAAETGVTDTTIKIGLVQPFSGPASAYSQIAKTDQAYIKMLNDTGGVCGRQIDLIAYDDGYSPPKTVEQTRKLVESDEVMFIFNGLGTPTNSAILKYMNAKKVPQLFVATGASKFGDPKGHPWTMGWQPNYVDEGKIYAAYIRENLPDGKIGVLYQNDDYGKDYLNGLKAGLGDKASMIVAEQPYETSDPTVDSQIINLKASGADIFVNVGTPKFAAQAIKKAAEIDWKPTQFLNSVSNSVGAVLKPAGLEASTGVISAAYLKDPQDPQWKDDAGLKKWHDFMDKYYPDGDKTSSFTIYGYGVSQTLEHVLRSTCDDLTRAGVMKAAANIKDLELDVSLPGINVNTGPDDFYPLQSMQLEKFNGERFELFGNVLDGASASN
ncbi:branched-chain amino acid ABC transporter substrate-binding protein [Zhengella mangrovi]|uniref:Branched-chain amino acid ABC transporter substrate-binding protein n=1 Tax=Zhengella mangrovi TaxID=1982044 RepID=A0A2G1QQA7_9HYPH|nr:ABC transporter substrate-binding protein [Zhengella mangrovi]PHP67408.1 branched-chain amino acid ABC transporter substrate-binding protein [Zhengella mangrovi]